MELPRPDPLHGPKRPGQSGEGPVLAQVFAPDEIEKRSFAIIEAECGRPPFSGYAWRIARRLVHAAGDLSLLGSLWLPDEAIAAGLAALEKGATIFTDTQMVRSGIPMRRLKAFGSGVECILPPKAPPGVTRARAGILGLGASLGGSIVAVGNAPTAIIALLDHLDAGGAAPALIIGMPVGFVNAAECKELLIQKHGAICLSLRGRRGGSPLAAAAVNALACILAGLE